MHVFFSASPSWPRRFLDIRCIHTVRQIVASVAAKAEAGAAKK
jgi:hypothetical protein